MNSSPPLRVLSSMAGRKLLGDLISKFEATSEHRVALKGAVRKIEVKDELGLATIKK